MNLHGFQGFESLPLRHYNEEHVKILILVMLCVVVGCGRDAASDFPEGAPMADTGITKLQIVDSVVGTGAEARPGRTVRVHYTGWLYDASKPDKRGNKFDSSKDSGEPFDFSLGGQARSFPAGTRVSPA